MRLLLGYDIGCAALVAVPMNDYAFCDTTLR